MTEKKKKITFNALMKEYWGLSRQRQEAFLKALYQMNPQTKNIFTLWLGKEKAVVIDAIKKEVKKETIDRVGRYRKLRLSKINEILRNAEKISLPILDRIEIKNLVWRGMLAFLLGRKYLPERYELACARHLEEYIQLVRLHVLEASEVEDRLNDTQKFLAATIACGHYMPHIEDVYLQHFFTRTDT